MKRMRLKITLLIVWLLLLFNLERVGAELAAPLGLGPFALAVAVALALLFLLVPMRRGHAYLAVAGALAGYALVQTRGGASLFAGGPYATLVEIAALIVSAGLAWLVSQDLHDFVQAVEAISLPEGRPDLLAYEQIDERLQAEIERARRYQRPFSVAMIELDPETYAAALHRAVRETQMSMIGRYVQIRFGTLLSRHIRQTDLLAHDAKGRRFLLLAPENPVDQTVQMLGRLERTIYGQLGVRFRYSVADFPGTALTSEELLRRVTEALRYDGEAPRGAGEAIQLPKSAALAYSAPPDERRNGHADSGTLPDRLKADG